MFLRKPGSRWARLGGGIAGVFDEVFAPYRHEVMIQAEARQQMPQERPDSEGDRD